MKLTILKGIKFDYPGVTIPIYDKIKRELRRENFDV